MNVFFGLQVNKRIAPLPHALKSNELSCNRQLKKETLLAFRAEWCVLKEG